MCKGRIKIGRMGEREGGEIEGAREKREERERRGGSAEVIMADLGKCKGVIIGVEIGQISSLLTGNYLRVRA